MRKVAVMTDSASDIPLDLQKKYNIGMVSLSIATEGKTFVERVDFTPQEYYELLRNARDIPSTSQVPPFSFFEAYAKYAQEGCDDLIVATINAGASGTYNSARVAVEQFVQDYPDSAMKIHVVDSGSYSMGYGYPICRAGEMARKGAAAEEILGYLKDFFSSVEIAIAPYTLRYIQKSGRISAAAAFAGGVIGLRPIITLIAGESKVRSKVRGDKNVLPGLCGYFCENVKQGDPYLIGTTDKKRGKLLADLCKKAVGYPPEEIFYLGCCVTTNTGPDADGIVYLGKHKRENG